MERMYGMADFQILQSIGSGTFGCVDKVRRKSDQQILALKQVKMDKLTEQQKNMAINQIRLLASIKSPYVISYQGSFYQQQTNTLCLLMEFANHGDLESIILKYKNKKMKGISEQFIWRTAIQVLIGLRTLHTHKIAHRDIKPGNIFLMEVAKIGDLNVSSFGNHSFCKTNTGTPYYTAPEIWNGQRYTSKCDVWSIGCIIYEMCCFRPPFRGQNIPQLFSVINRGVYEEIGGKYSGELKWLIRQCLNLNQFKRPSAADLLESDIIKNKMLIFNQNQQETGHVDLIKPIKCPKMLHNLNDILPAKPSQQSERPKKTTFKQETESNTSQKMADQRNRKKVKSMIRIRTNRSINYKSEKIIQAEGLAGVKVLKLDQLAEMKQNKKNRAESVKTPLILNIKPEIIKNRMFRLRSYKKMEDKEKENIDK